MKIYPETEDPVEAHRNALYPRIRCPFCCRKTTINKIFDGGKTVICQECGLPIHISDLERSRALDESLTE